MSSCASTVAADPNAAVSAITADEAARLHGRAGVEFVDPRPIDAIYATTGLIPGARVISINDIEAGNLPPAFGDKSLRVITSCMAGPMAAKAAEAFLAQGFNKVSYVEGGTTAWVEAGHPTVC